MKNTFFLRSLVVTLVLLPLLCLPWLFADRDAPRFIPGKAKIPAADNIWISYPFLAANSFDGDRMWITVRAQRTSKSDVGYHVYLFDMTNQTVMGELINASAEVFDRNQTKVLCSQRKQPDKNPVRKFFHALMMLGRTKGKTTHTSDDEEIFWLVDLKKNTAVRLGSVFQGNGAGSSFRQSPDHRYCFNHATALGSGELYICDLDEQTFHFASVAGYPAGWWDNQQILLKGEDGGLSLYDVNSRKTNSLTTRSQLQTFYADAGLTNDPARINPFTVWNGDGNDFYLSDGSKRWSAEQSFLAKIDRTDHRPKMIDSHFKFEWSDHFAPAFDTYLYSGREQGKTNSAVYLRDLKSSKTRELVPADVNNPKLFSIPRFYRNEVVYCRSNSLWEINVDGSNNRRLFPPPDAP